MQTFPKVVLQFSKKKKKSPLISTFGICGNLLLYGNILFWLLSSTIRTFITLQQTKINTSRLIHDRQRRNCVTTATMAIWQSPRDNSRCAILKARVHAAMRLVTGKLWVHCRFYLAAAVRKRACTEPDEMEEIGTKLFINLFLFWFHYY